MESWGIGDGRGLMISRRSVALFGAVVVSMACLSSLMHGSLF
jgi:hypothetical protein